VTPAEGLGLDRAGICKSMGKKVKGWMLGVMEEMGTRQEVLAEVAKVDLDVPIVKNDFEEEMNPKLKELCRLAEEIRMMSNRWADTRGERG
jgi:hypothetical protein